MIKRHPGKQISEHTKRYESKATHNCKASCGYGQEQKILETAQLRFLRPLQRLTRRHKQRNAESGQYNRDQKLPTKLAAACQQHGEQLLTKISNAVSAPWKWDIGRPRRRWRGQDHVKVNELHSTGLSTLGNAKYTIGAVSGDVTSPLVMWLMRPRDSRDHLMRLPHVRFVVPKTFRPVGFLTIRFFLKLLHILMALNNKKILYRFLQLQYIVTARITKARVLQLIVGRPRKTLAGNSEQLGTRCSGVPRNFFRGGGVNKFS